MELDTNYTDVRRTAKILGLHHYPIIFKLCSKFAHPTAMNIFNFVNDERLDHTLRMFFILGGISARNTNHHIGYFLNQRRKNV